VNQQQKKPHAVRRPSPDSHRTVSGQRKKMPSYATDSLSRTSRGNSDLRNNLQSQTPLNRRMRQKKAAPADPGTIRRATKPQYYRIKDDTPKRSGSMFGKRVLLVLICYAILMPLSVLAVALILPHHTTPETNDFIYQVGPDNGYYSRNIYSWDMVRTGNVYYLNMSELATYCNMTTTGDDSTMRYIVKETGETVEFVLGQSIAYINGIQERTGGDAYIRGGNIYVPLDFVNRCFHGIETGVDLEKAKITVLRQTDADGNYVTVSFPYKPISTTTSIRFADLAPDLQLQILIQNQPPAPEEPDANPPNDDQLTNTQ